MTLWVHFANIFLGFWLLVAPKTFGFGGLTAWSDFITALVVIVFGFLSLSRRIIIAPWIVCFAGIWLQFAPLLFWTKEVSGYLNDTFIGVFLILFSIIIPGLPGFLEETGKEIPRGWSYNPSAWIQRLPVVMLACVGWFISRYLASYQLGYITSVWDPIFDDGTRLVITSKLSHSFPIPDAGLGAFAYTLEALLGLKGGPGRWRTMPWLVIGFAFLVVPLGLVSILLVISQPLIVGAWCFLCLIAALSMLLMVVLTIDEMFAVIQFLHQARKERRPFWRTFWKGGEVSGLSEDFRTPPFDSNPFRLIHSWRFGIGFRWNLFLTALLGGYLMLTPWIWTINRLGSDNDHLFGALALVISIISLAEPARSFRYLLLPIGIWVIVSTWLISGHTIMSDLNHVLIGVFLFIVAIPRGRIVERYGTIEKLIK